MRVRLLGDHSAYHCGSQAVWATARRLLSQVAELVEDGEEHDALVMNGEGSMHHGSPAFHAKMRQLAHAQSRGLRTFLVNTVWQDNPPTHDATLAALDGLIARGEASRRDLAQRHAAPAAAALDLSYYEPIDETAPALDWSGRVVVTDVWAEEFGFAFLSADQMRDWVRVDMRTLSWSSLVRSLRKADLLVTGRHHAMYAAARARLPFVPVRGNSHKFLDLFAATRAPIPICRGLREIAGVVGWARRNRAVYERLFDAMAATAPPDLLAARPTRLTAGAPAYAASSLAAMADVRGDYPRACARWEEAARTADDRCAALTRAAIAGLRGGCIEDGARLAFEARLADPARAAAGRVIDERLDAELFWLQPDRSDFLGEGWAGAAHRAAEAAAAGDDDGFRAAAARTLTEAAARSPETMASARLLLTLRLIALTRCELAQSFWRASATARPEWERIEDDFRVLTRAAPFSHAAAQAREALVGMLATPQGSARVDLRARLVEQDWLARPPDAHRAADAAEQARAARGDGATFANALASCLEAGEADIAASLAAFAPTEFAALARACAPVAAFARDQGLCASGDATIARLAAAWDRARAVEAELLDRLADASRSLAVVGNGPRERGRGSGAVIDARDEVIRFNRFALGPRWRADYGARTTIVVSVNPARLVASAYAALPAGTIVAFVTQKRAFLERDWEAIDAMTESGLRLCFPFAGAREALGRRFGFYPSTGLMAIERLSALRADFSRGDLFGFDFGPDATGRYAYDDPRLGSEKHDWDRERLALDAILPA